MAYTHRLQTNRRELKYIVDETTARAVRDFVRPFLVPDENADPWKNYAYAIHSLYLDSPTFDLCKATMCGHKNRFKLRIRFYNELPDQPVFFEIKGRVQDTILKDRAVVKRSSVPELLRYRWPETSDLMPGKEGKYPVLQKFCRLMNVLKAEGKVFVSYTREAWVTPDDDSVRITFDRKLTVSPCNDEMRIFPYPDHLQPRVPQDTHPGLVLLNPPAVVLELKFTERFPMWMGTLTRTFDLQRSDMAKYVACVQAARPTLRPVATRHQRAAI